MPRTSLPHNPCVTSLSHRHPTPHRLTGGAPSMDAIIFAFLAARICPRARPSGVGERTLACTRLFPDLERRRLDLDLLPELWSRFDSRGTKPPARFRISCASFKTRSPPIASTAQGLQALAIAPRTSGTMSSGLTRSLALRSRTLMASILFTCLLRGSSSSSSSMNALPIFSLRCRSFSSAALRSASAFFLASALTLSSSFCSLAASSLAASFFPLCSSSAFFCSAARRCCSSRSLTSCCSFSAAAAFLACLLCSGSRSSADCSLSSSYSTTSPVPVGENNSAKRL
mmetsp:Transcript_43706/g.100899  ORF Transcript_43706/g.100899 Transcript_43706/m.100899 type:complete len:286 (+) Transcript_43706:73-930(+)